MHTHKYTLVRVHRHKHTNNTETDNKTVYPDNKHLILGYVIQ